MNGILHYQEEFLIQLKSNLNSNINLVDELTDLLKVSKDTVYRRLKCQSAFSFDEVIAISDKYGIKLNSFLQQSAQQVSFDFNPIYEVEGNLEKYLNGLSDYILELSKIPSVKVIYAAEDVPFLRHLHYPTLSAFKIYYWNRAVLNNAKFKGKKFNEGIISDNMAKINQRTFQHYCQINSIEIWTEETLISTLKQVEYFWESDLFENKNQALRVIDDIQLMMDELKRECEDGHKNIDYFRGEFKLFFSEVLLGSNCVLVVPGESKLRERVFLGHNTFNNISTYNASFCKETMLWMDNLIKKSFQLSESSEKQRAVFFKKMASKIGELQFKVLSE